MGLTSVVTIAFLTACSFAVAMTWNPMLMRFLRAHRMGKQIRDGKSAPIMSALHQKKAGTPSMGGLLVWMTTLGLALLFWILSEATPFAFFKQINFLTRKETFLPLGALAASALVGLVDDLFNVRKIGPNGGGLRMRHRLALYTLIAAIGAWWFYVKLEWDTIHVPFVGNFSIGWWYIPIFIFIIVATAFSVNETDGLDGLAGGTLLTSFGAYGAIAFVQGRYDLAALCSVIVGALLAFLWYNIFPARYFMGDTGVMALGVTLGIVAMLTNNVLLLPIIGFLFVLVSG